MMSRDIRELERALIRCNQAYQILHKQQEKDTIKAMVIMLAHHQRVLFAELYICGERLIFDKYQGLLINLGVSKEEIMQEFELDPELKELLDQQMDDLAKGDKASKDLIR